MNDVYVLTGGNLGDRTAMLKEAKDAIGMACGQVVKASALYETAAWGPVPQPAYYNQVLHLHTGLAPVQLLNALLDIEKKLGRFRQERYGPRTIDIDILFYNQEVHDTEELIIPHPRLYLRRFALVPLCEIAPQWLHPILGKTMLQLLHACTDPLDVKKIIAEDAAD